MPTSLKVRLAFAIVASALLGAVAAAVPTLSDTVALYFQTRGTTVIPVSATTDWISAVTAGGATTADASTITAPSTQITASTRRVVGRQIAGGTGLLVRMKYDASLTVSVSPTIRIFGRTSGGAWQTLTSRAGTVSAVLTASTASDVSDGTYKYTTVDLAAHYFDCQGYDEFLVGIETALAGTGTTSTATIDLKPL